MTELNSHILDSIAQAKNLLAFARKHRKFLSTLSEQVYIESCYGAIRLQYGTHDDAIKCIKKFGGKWNKAKSGTQVTYRRGTPLNGNIGIALYYFGPPANCVIVKRTVVVEAQPAKEAYTYETEELQCIVPNDLISTPIEALA